MSEIKKVIKGKGFYASPAYYPNTNNGIPPWNSETAIRDFLEEMRKVQKDNKAKEGKKPIFPKIV